MDRLVNIIYNLFVIRSDTHLRQIQPGEKIEGFKQGDFKREKRKGTKEDIRQHLKGYKTIGFYNLSLENKIKWVCIDVDKEEDWKERVINIRKEITKLGIKSYVELSGSPNSAHIWIFTVPETTAKEGKRFAEYVVKKAGYKVGKEKGEIEVFPKQEVLTGKRFGNFVKLPLGINWKPKLKEFFGDYPKSHFVNDNFEPLTLKGAYELLKTVEPVELPEIPEIETTDNTTTEKNTIKKTQAKKSLSEVLPFVKPCIQTAYLQKRSLTGGAGHDFRLACGRELVYLGASDNAIHEFFKIQPDYDFEKTQYHIEDLRNNPKFKPFKCKTIQSKSNSLVAGVCKNCDRNKEDFDEFDYAERIWDNYRYFYQDLSDLLWGYENGIYKMITKYKLYSKLREYFGIRRAGSGFTMNFERSFKVLGSENIPEEPPKSHLVFEDCIYDIEQQKKLEHSPVFFYASRIPHKLGSSEETPTIDKLFEEWVGKEYKQLLYELVAYCMLPDYPIHRVFVLLGSGRNGKGQFQELISRFVGKENTANTTLERLNTNRFETSHLYKKLVALIDETNKNSLRISSVIKALSGGSDIPFEFKNKNIFHDKSYAKLIISTNELPTTNDNTIGFFSRFIIIEFPNQYDIGKDIVDSIPEEEYQNLAKKCVRILSEVLDRGYFTNEGSPEEKRERYLQYSEPVLKFFEYYCEFSEEDKIPLYEFSNRFVAWNEAHGNRKLTRNEISERLASLGVEKERFHTNINGKEHNYYYYLGIKWKELQTKLNIQTRRKPKKEDSTENETEDNKQSEGERQTHTENITESNTPDTASVLTDTKEDYTTEQATDSNTEATTENTATEQEKKDTTVNTSEATEQETEQTSTENTEANTERELLTDSKFLEFKKAVEKKKREEEERERTEKERIEKLKEIVREKKQELENDGVKPTATLIKQTLKREHGEFLVTDISDILKELESLG